jgi:hypothetical protein
MGACWRLVGLELPDGQRVMVGDSFWSDAADAALVVTAIAHAGLVMIRSEGGESEGEIGASYLRTMRKLHGRESATSVTVPAEPAAPTTRDQRRREIDAILREDARAVPAFAKARLRAVVAVLDQRNNATLARDILAELHRYEAHRGGETRPRRDLTRWLPAAVHEAVEVYERSRGLSRAVFYRLTLDKPAPVAVALAYDDPGRANQTTAERLRQLGVEAAQLADRIGWSTQGSGMPEQSDVDRALRELVEGAAKATGEDRRKKLGGLAAWALFARSLEGMG